MLRRFQTRGNFDRDLSRTRAALALCSSPTVIGYGSLLMAQNRALYSFGVFRDHRLADVAVRGAAGDSSAGRLGYRFFRIAQIKPSGQGSDGSGMI